MLTQNLHIAAIACALCGGQYMQPHAGGGRAVDPRTLQRLDETLQDTGPLRTSLLLQPIDLRQPLGFDQVYRLPGGGANERLARISGGLSAVFPRSAYVTTAKGPFALVPPGTVFYIGTIPVENAARPINGASEDTRTQTRWDSATDAAPIAGVASRVINPPQNQSRHRDTATSPERGIMTDETYRASRVRQLLQFAAAGSQHFR